MEVIGFIIGLIIFLGIIGGFFFLLYYIIKRLVNGKPKKKAVNKKEIVKKYLPHEVVKVEDVESGKTVHFGNKSKVVIGYDDFEKVKIYNFYECCGYLGDKLPIYSDLFFGIGFKKVDDQSDHDLFTNKNIPRNWDEATLKSKVDYFGKRFGKVKKALGYGREYGLYSFRHTAILDLYNSLVDEGMSEQEILFKLMPITQHKSIAGLKNYLRNHKKSLPKDHSDIYTIDF